ncbi:hypothetical protein GCM10020258_31250 [Sphingomonas yabuuchiae]
MKRGGKPLYRLAYFAFDGRPSAGGMCPLDGYSAGFRRTPSLAVSRLFEAEPITFRSWWRRWGRGRRPGSKQGVASAMGAATSKQSLLMSLSFRKAMAGEAIRPSGITIIHVRERRMRNPFEPSP